MTEPNDPHLKAVPISDFNEVELEGLFEGLEAVIDRYIERKGATCAEIIGVLETLKFTIMKEQHDELQ